MKRTQRTVKYLISTLFALAGTLIFGQIAHGQDITAGNSTTGADSSNKATVSLGSSQSIDVNNSADVNNNICITANTGGNSASKNTGDGSVASGAASVTANASTSANSVAISGGSGVGTGGSVDVSNGITGADSNNQSKVTVKNSSNVNVDNQASVSNNVHSNIQTGNNSADKNTGDGSVTSGNATFNSTISTAVNQAMIDLGLAGGFGNTNATLSNQMTGYGSDNSVLFKNENSSSVNVDNTANVDNHYNGNVDTGNNSADKNTGDGTSNSGDVNAAIVFDTMANKADLSLGRGAGNTVVTIKNDTTGAKSDNKVDLNLENENKVDVHNNANIDNSIQLDAQTGNNSADKNTGDGSVTSGNVNSTFTVGTEANSATLDLGSGIGGDITVNAQNQRTGYNSDNNINIDVQNESKTKINNDLNVDNNINIDAQTGNNSADKNTGDGSVTSGNVIVDGTLTTTGNSVTLSDTGLGSGSIDVSASNNITGAASDNHIDLGLKNKMGLDINNDTNVGNNVNIDGQTGNNSSDENTGDGNTTSGDTTVDLTAHTTGGVIGNGSGDLGFGDFTIDSIDGVNQNLNGNQGVHVTVNGTDLL